MLGIVPIVIVEEDLAIQAQRSVEPGAFRAQRVGIHRLGVEGCGVAALPVETPGLEAGGVARIKHDVIAGKPGQAGAR